MAPIGSHEGVNIITNWSSSESADLQHSFRFTELNQSLVNLEGASFGELLILQIDEDVIRVNWQPRVGCV